MESLLTFLVTLLQISAAGLLVYGMALALKADVGVMKAFRAARGDGVLPARPANVTIEAATA